VIVNDALRTRDNELELATALSDAFMVARYDRRGRGDSGDTQPYAPKREIEDLRAVIDAVGGWAGVYGAGFGGVLALDAVEAGLHISKAAVYEPPFVFDDSRPPYPAGFVDSLRQLLRAGRRREVVDAYLRHTSLLPEIVIENTRDLPFRAHFEALAHTLVYDYEVLGERMLGRPMPTVLQDWIRIPLLVMEHDMSPRTIRNTAAILAALLPRATKRTFRGNDRAVPPTTMARTLQTFFRGDATAAGRATTRPTC
jgi:hypothetical protein